MKGRLIVVQRPDRENARLKEKSPDRCNKRGFLRPAQCPLIRHTKPLTPTLNVVTLLYVPLFNTMLDSHMANGAARHWKETLEGRQ
jgi:hypothetical protein